MIYAGEVQQIPSELAARGLLRSLGISGIIYILLKKKRILVFRGE